MSAQRWTLTTLSAPPSAGARCRKLYLDFPIIIPKTLHKARHGASAARCSRLSAHCVSEPPDLDSDVLLMAHAGASEQYDTASDLCCPRPAAARAQHAARSTLEMRFDLCC